MKATGFLDAQQQELFDRDYQQYRRHVKLVPASEKKGNAEELQNLVRTELEAFEHQARGFQCLLVAVRAKDGLSWAAAAVDEVAAAPKLRSVERIHVIGRGELEGVPEIIDAVGRKRFTRLAEKRALATPSFFESTWVRAVVAAVILAIGVGGLSAKQLAGSASSVSSLAQPGFLLFATVSVVMAFVGQQLVPLLNPGPRTKLAVLAAQLTKNTNALEYKAFVGDLARALATGTRSRCLTVDGYHKLDETSKRVLRRYLNEFADKTQRSELWVILDQAPFNAFKKDMDVDRIAGTKPASIEFYELLPMSAPDRKRLAHAYGHPERGDYDTVGAITGTIEWAGFDDLFRSQMRPAGAATYSPLDLFYVIAVTAGCGEKWTIQDSTIEKNFRDSNLKRNTILAVLLPGTNFSLKDVHQSLRSTKKAFRDLIFDASGDGTSFDISEEAGAALIERWKDYGLSDPRLCHLFWSLFWRDKLVEHPLEAFWTDRLTRHILGVGSLREIGQDSPDIKRALFQATMFAITQSLAATLLATIPELLEMALALISDDGSEAAAQASRLRKACWETYSVLGDDQILQTIGTLRSVIEPGRDGRRTLDPLESLFLESVGITGAPQWDGNEAVRLYARLRTIWLVQTLAPFISVATPSMVKAAMVTQDELLRSVHSPHVLLKDPDSREVVNYLCASLTLWCLAVHLTPGNPRPVVFQLDQIRRVVDDLETIILQATDILTNALNSDATSSTDYIGVGATNEVIVLARGCAARLAMALADTPVDVSIGRRLTELVWWDAGGSRAHSSASPDNLDRALLDVERRLDLVHVMWATFGFHQLAQFSHLRREQLMVSPGASKPPAWTVVSSSLSLEETKEGYVGVLANAIAAYAAGIRGEVPANFISRGVNRALEGKIAPRLGAELGLMAIEVGNIFDIDFLQCVAALMAQDRKGRIGKNLTSILDSAPDGGIPQLSQALCNVMLRIPAGELPNKIRVSLHERIKVIGDAANRDEADQTLDLFELKQRATNRAISPDDIESTLDIWARRQESWMFDSVLRQLLTSLAAPESGRLLDEVGSALEKRANEVQLTSNAPISLAIEAAKLAPISHRSLLLSQAVALLRRHLPLMSTLVPLESRIAGYWILRKNDKPMAHEYAKELERLEVFRHERDEARLLPLFLSQGAYFKLFLHYFETLHPWGLRADVETDKLFAKFQLPQSDREKTIRTWREAGQPMPKPIVTDKGEEVLGADFLFYGFCLVNDPFETDKAYEKLRKPFNDQAFGALPMLYRIVSHLPSVPGGIRQALARHESRMETYTQPK